MRSTRVYAFRVGKGTGRPITESTSWAGILEASQGRFRLITPLPRSEFYRNLAHIFLGLVPITLLAFLVFRVLDARITEIAGGFQPLLLIAAVFGFIAIIIIASAYVFLLMDVALVGYQVRHPGRVMDVEVRLQRLGRFRHMVIIKAEGVDRVLNLVGSRRSLQSALDLAKNQ